MENHAVVYSNQINEIKALRSPVVDIHTVFTWNYEFNKRHEWLSKNGQFLMMIIFRY